ncbi:MAG: NPCBM/NEW2 domain-containing protein [Christensenella sp.]|nr:NPCBM/NEW2 domain-containing protein [Christensenella sp.]
MASVIFITLTIVFILICIILTFKKVQPPKNALLYTEKGSGARAYDPKHRKRVIGSGICMALSILTMLLSIIFAGATPTPIDSTPSPSSSSSINETPDPIVSSSPGNVVERTPKPFESETVELSNSDWLDELTPLPCHPGNYYFGGWGDKSPFDLNGVEFDHGVGMCIIGSNFEQMVKKKDAYQNIERWDCREASVLFQFNEKYETLIFSVGVDSSDPALYGPREENGVVQIIIDDSSANKELFRTDWIDYTYVTKTVKINVSTVDTLRITVRSGSVNRKRITKSLRVVLINPVLIPIES